MRTVAGMALSVSLLLVTSSMGSADVTVAVNPSTQYQTILGWGGVQGTALPLSDQLRGQILDAVISDFGLTRLRVGPPNGNAYNMTGWEWDNDNADPGAINWSALNTADFDNTIQSWILPFKQRVEANGDHCSIWISPSFFDNGSTGTAPAWLLYSPGEAAEFAMSLLLYLKNTYGVDVDHYVVMNEPGNNNAWTPDVLGRVIKVLGPRMQAAGLATKIQFSDSVHTGSTWNYIQALQNDADVWPHVGLITWHLYGGGGYRTTIYNWAQSRGLPTGMTEYMNETFNDLYSDLTDGGVVTWDVYGFTNRTNTVTAINNSLTNFTRGASYWTFRQVFHYVRPGAVRVGTSVGGTGGVQALAFTRNGRTTVVLYSTVATNVTVSGLPTRQYGLCQEIGGAAYTELGLRTVDGSGSTVISGVPANAVVTLYPYAGSNLPPTITDCRASPDALRLPTAGTSLVAAAQDPEKATLSYGWSIKSQPAGANATIVSPSASTTTVNNMSVAGQYLFTVAVSDGIGTTRLDLAVNVYTSNQPPIINDCHNRLPTLVILPTNSTTIRAGGFDPEGDAVSYNWTIVSQPAGASASIAAPTSTNTTLNNMNVPGNYVLQLSMSDATHTVSTTLTIPVYADPSAPVITNMVSSPASPHAGRVVDLSATTSDADADTVTHWWSVKSSPAGTKPVFDTPGLPATTVSGLTAAGTYVFTLSAIDLSHVTSRDVTVTVDAALTGDINLDGYVDVVDLLIFVDAFGSAVGDANYDVRCDLNHDGYVDVVDLLTFVENFGAE